jgi:ATP-dependent NAD(P)H-hydrate dehydratase
MQKWGKECLSVAKEMGKWVVLDADGLWAVTNEPEIIKGYEKAILVSAGYFSLTLND